MTEIRYLVLDRLINRSLTATYDLVGDGGEEEVRGERGRERRGDGRSEEGGGGREREGEMEEGRGGRDGRRERGGEGK